MRASHIARFAVLSLSLAAFAVTTPRSAAALQPASSDNTVVTTPSSWLGVYRLTLVGTDNTPTAMRLLVEREGDGVSGTLITVAQGPAHADLRVHGDALWASAETSQGSGALVLRLTADGVTGTFTVGRKVWTVTGARTT